MLSSVPAANAFQGPRASYVALSCIATISFGLLATLSLDLGTGYIAILGLIAVYMASTELLILYVVISPLSMIVDIVRLAQSSRFLQHRGWLIFFAICYLISKVVGALFGYSIYKSVTSAPGGAGANYQPVSAHDPFHAQPAYAPAYAPPHEPGSPSNGPSGVPTSQTQSLMV